MTVAPLRLYLTIRLHANVPSARAYPYDGGECTYLYATVTRGTTTAFVSCFVVSRSYVGTRAVLGGTRSPTEGGKKRPPCVGAARGPSRRPRRAYARHAGVRILTLAQAHSLGITTRRRRLCLATTTTGSWKPRGAESTRSDVSDAGRWSRAVVRRNGPGKTAEYIWFVCFVLLFSVSLPPPFREFARFSYHSYEGECFEVFLAGTGIGFLAEYRPLWSNLIVCIDYTTRSPPLNVSRIHLDRYINDVQSFFAKRQRIEGRGSWFWLIWIFGKPFTVKS